MFSITVVVLQLTSSQFSPRGLRSFLRSRTSQAALGVFAATFVYAVVVLRSVQGDEHVPPFVPQVAVTFSFLLLLASVGLFIRFIQHITQSIRVSTIIGGIGRETRALVARAPPASRSDRVEAGSVSWPAPGPTRSVPSATFGVLVRVDVAELVRCVTRAGCLLALRVRLGDYVPEGRRVAEVRGGTDQVEDAAVLAGLRFAEERTMEQDVAFGFRQLVDIAERALSPGVNDPTAAVQTLDEMHDLLRRLAGRPDPPPGHVDDDGTVRLLLLEPSFADHLDLALDEVIQYGAESLQVRQRLTGLLDDLTEAARPEHRPAIAAKRRRLAEAMAGAA